MLRFLRHGLPFVLVLAGSAFISGQSKRFGLGPLTVAIPGGWIFQPGKGEIRFYSPDSTPEQYFAVEFYPQESISQEVREHHSVVWSRLAARSQPAGPPQNGVLGQFIWTRAELRRPPGQTQTLILYSAKVGAIYVAIVAEATRADLVLKNLPDVEAMLNNATLSPPPVRSTR